MGKNKYGSEEGFEPITSQQMYRIENNGEELMGMRKILMMENAGSRVSDFLLNYFKEDLSQKKIVSVCGMGNNGGDAMVANRHLSGYLSSKFSASNNSNSNSANLVLALPGKPSLIKTEEARTNWNIVQRMDSIKKIFFDTENGVQDLESEIEKSDIIIDGLFGTGIKGAIKDPFSRIIDKINRQKSKSFILSVDIPSGLNPDDGKISDKCVKADTTITFHRIKQGLLKNIEYSGNILPVKIGIPIEAEMEVVV
jgi:NAD(P)H-hydrate epimerase